MRRPDTHVDGAGGVSAFELQLLGRLKAIARLEDDVVAEPVARADPDMVGEHGFGRRNLGHRGQLLRVGQVGVGGPQRRHRVAEQLLGIVVQPALVHPDESQPAADIGDPVGAGPEIVPRAREGAELVGGAGDRDFHREGNRVSGRVHALVGHPGDLRPREEQLAFDAEAPAELVAHRAGHLEPGFVLRGGFGTVRDRRRLPQTLASRRRRFRVVDEHDRHGEPGIPPAVAPSRVRRARIRCRRRRDPEGENRGRRGRPAAPSRHAEDTCHAAPLPCRFPCRAPVRAPARLAARPRPGHRAPVGGNRRPGKRVPIRTGGG